MNRNTDSFLYALFAENVVAAIHSEQLPTMLFKNSGKLFTSYLLHTAIS